MGMLSILLFFITEAPCPTFSFVPPNNPARIQQQQTSCFRLHSNMVPPKKTTSNNAVPVQRSNRQNSNNRAPPPNNKQNKRLVNNNNNNKRLASNGVTRDENSLKVTTKLKEMKQRASKGERLTRTFRFFALSAIMPMPTKLTHFLTIIYRILL